DDSVPDEGLRQGRSDDLHPARCLKAPRGDASGVPATHVPRPLRLPPTIVDGAGNFTLELRARNDPINESMFDQEFAGLESLGELDADRRLDGPRPGEANQ